MTATMARLSDSPLSLSEPSPVRARAVLCRPLADAADSETGRAPSLVPTASTVARCRPADRPPEPLR